MKLVNLLFLIWIFTETKATISNVNRKRKQYLRKKKKISKLAQNAIPKTAVFRLLELERETPNLFGIVTKFLDAKGFLRLALGSTHLHQSMNGSLENLIRHLNEEFVTNFPKYFVTHAHFPPFPEKNFILPYFHSFCRVFGTEVYENQNWNRDDRNPQKMIRFSILWKNDKFEKLAFFLEKGKLLFAQTIGSSFRLYKHENNRVPWIIAKNGILEGMNYNLFPPKAKKIANEYVIKFNFPPEITIVSYLTPENFHANIRKLPFAAFPDFK